MIPKNISKKPTKFPFFCRITHLSSLNIDLDSISFSNRKILVPHGVKIDFYINQLENFLKVTPCGTKILMLLEQIESQSVVRLLICVIRQKNGNFVGVLGIFLKIMRNYPMKCRICLNSEIR